MTVGIVEQFRDNGPTSLAIAYPTVIRGLELYFASLLPLRELLGIDRCTFPHSELGAVQ